MKADGRLVSVPQCTRCRSIKWEFDHNFHVRRVERWEKSAVYISFGPFYYAVCILIRMHSRNSDYVASYERTAEFVIKQTILADLFVKLFGFNSDLLKLDYSGEKKSPYTYKKKGNTIKYCFNKFYAIFTHGHDEVQK